MIYIIISFNLLNIIFVSLLFIKLNKLIANIERLDYKISNIYISDNTSVKNISRANSTGSNNSNTSKYIIDNYASINKLSQSDDILYAKNKNISSGTLFDLNTIKKYRKKESDNNI
tara:strand:+ start:275 stop:622 length:348 start_codon:yes stop_codon:yes gene_type:complete